MESVDINKLLARIEYLERELAACGKQPIRENTSASSMEEKLAELLKREQEERIRAEQALSVLRHTEQRFQTLFGSNIIGIVEINHERILDANQSFLEMTGHSREDLLAGKLVRREMTATPYLGMDEAAHERVIRDGSFPPFEKELYRRDGTVVPVWVGGVLLNPAPDWTCMEFVLDLSERKVLEAQFHSAQKLKSLGVLSSVIAHDFNNLLTTMIGNSSLSLDALSPDHPAYPYIEEVLRASQLASGLTSQLVGYSSKSRNSTQTVEISKLVREIGDLIELPLSRNVELRCTMEEGIPAIHGNAYLVQQILMNLVINASDAVGERSGAIRITTHCREYASGELEAMTMGASLPSGRYVTVEVSDNGCGMSEEVKARIFDPLFTTKARGRGLGLAATLGIVRSHRGAIDVRTRVGEGTTFSVLFPASTQNVEVQAPIEHDANLRGHGTILVVDDEPSVRRLAQATLSRYGYKVLLASNGHEGVEIYRREPESISLILMDVSMPVMNGHEALQQLLTVSPNPPVLFTSGYNSAESIRQVENYPFLQKPYTSKQLAERVKEIHSRPN